MPRPFNHMLGFVVFLLASPTVLSQSHSDLAEMSLESLMNIEVTSVSRKEQPTSQIAAAVFVINQEDIRRSGANNIPDLLRMVPGVQVAQISANTWAISIRGFDQQFSNKLLVLLDGRSVYLPTFSGVFWDALDLPLEDIERIEVIRGPGATTWGANAVNGVINIITKKATKTHGAMLVAGSGNLQQEFGTLQYGGSLGYTTDFRVFGKYLNQHDMLSATAPTGGDGWHSIRAGFRLDSRVSEKDGLSLRGDVYGGSEGWINRSYKQPAFSFFGSQYTKVPFGGGYIQSEWKHNYSARSDSTLQVSFDHYGRADALDETRNTVSLDFENHLTRGRHDLVWGAGYRYSSSHSDGSLLLSLVPADLATNLFSLFAEDELALLPNQLWLTLGTKLEHNHFTGFGWMPSARLAWKVNPHHMVWTAFSRSLRTPSSVDTGMDLNAASFLLPDHTPVLVRVLGNPCFEDENLLAYEAGYRSELSQRLSLDIAGFVNVYHKLKTQEPGAMFFEPVPFPPHLVLPVQFANLMEGQTHGIEISSSWKVTDRWTVKPAYAFEQLHLKLSPGSHDLGSVNFAQGGSPHHWAGLESQLDLPHHFSWQISATFTDRLPAVGVPSYVRTDSQVTWSAGENFSISVVGQNLLKDRHLEFVDPNGSALPSLLRRSVYAKLTWTF